MGEVSRRRFWVEDENRIQEKVEFRVHVKMPFGETDTIEWDSDFGAIRRTRLRRGDQTCRIKGDQMYRKGVATRRNMLFYYA